MHLNDLQNPQRLNALEAGSNKCACFVLPERHHLFIIYIALEEFPFHNYNIYTAYSARPKSRFKSWQEAKIKLQVA